MSEARYERTPDGKWHTHATDGTMRCEATQHEVDLMEAAYQLGLQSHPAPTDLLLTDEEQLPYIRDLQTHGSQCIPAIVNTMLEAQLSKLQQARPQPEQVREKLASVLYKQAGNSLEWKFAEPGMKLIFYGKADEIIKLRLLPDEQAIRKETAKEIRDAIANGEFEQVLGGILKMIDKRYSLEPFKSGERLEK